MRILYTCLFYLLLPAILLRLAWRGIKAPAYRERWQERLAFYRHRYPYPVIWLHAVSVGETEALLPLVKRLLSEYPQEHLLITTTTPTGSARVKAALQDRVSHVYLPYDLPDVLHRFTRCFQPKLAVIMETEIWPNLFAHCGQQGIPLYLVNARLSERSARAYRRVPSLIRPTLAHITCIASQSAEDSARFLAIGATCPVRTLGNVKFDTEIAADLRSQGQHLKSRLFAGRFVWLLASSHQGEEALVLPLYRQLKQHLPELLLLIAPRHPERFSEIGPLCQQQGLAWLSRTSGQACSAATDVYVVDTLGELKLFYAAADVGLVGGSLVPVGGHNVLEAAAVGVPVLFGPYMANFKAVAEGILAHNAAVQCQTVADIGAAILAVYNRPDYKDALIAQALAFVQANQGATGRLFGLLADELAQTPSVAE